MGNFTSSPSPTPDELMQEVKRSVIADHALQRDSVILVVGGGGTIGSSTALHLARRGYTNVRVLDIYPAPSRLSAGNDLNKVAGSQRDGLWGEIGQAAVAGWMNDPVFAPFYHPTGTLYCADTSPEMIASLKKRYEQLHREGRPVEWLDTRDDIVRRAPHLKNAELDGWKALWNPDGGWVEAANTLQSVGMQLTKLGVKSTFGTAGTFKAPLLSEDGLRCTGVVATDGTIWHADRVVLATGAWSPALVDLQSQCVSKCWVFAHILLTPAETAQMKDIPVMYHHRYGFFIEPKPENCLLKICNEFSGYTHLKTNRPFGASSDLKMSVPRNRATHPSDTIPTEALDEIRRLIRMCLPHLAGRPLINQTMCWCTDTPDANWLMCESPSYKGLYFATGDSGRTFNTIPVVGGEVADMLEGKLSESRARTWGWRPGKGDPQHTGRAGPPPKDLADVDGWQHHKERKL